MSQFETTSRRLEQFLFACGIRYSAVSKNIDGMTVWAYEHTPFLGEALAFYQRVLNHRKENA